MEPTSTFADMSFILTCGRKRYPNDLTSFADDNDARVVIGFLVIFFAPSSTFLPSSRISVTYPLVLPLDHNPRLRSITLQRIKFNLNSATSRVISLNNFQRNTNFRVSRIHLFIPVFVPSRVECIPCATQQIREQSHNVVLHLMVSEIVTGSFNPASVHIDTLRMRCQNCSRFVFYCRFYFVCEAFFGNMPSEIVLPIRYCPDTDTVVRSGGVLILRNHLNKVSKMWTSFSFCCLMLGISVDLLSDNVFPFEGFSCELCESCPDQFFNNNQYGFPAVPTTLDQSMGQQSCPFPCVYRPLNR